MRVRAKIKTKKNAFSSSDITLKKMDDLAHKQSLYEVDIYLPWSWTARRKLEGEDIKKIKFMKKFWVEK